MVHLAIFDPARRLRQLVQLIHGRAKRGAHSQARHITGCGPSSSKSVLDHALATSSADDHVTSGTNSFKFVGLDAVCDPTYYASERETRGDEASYYTLKMENTLFKVHKTVLVRGDCVFSDWKFMQGGLHTAKSTTPPIIRLPENASRFRDLLWALHKLDLKETELIFGHSMDRLLNIAELSRKYRFLPFEAWAVEQLYRICAGSALPFVIPAPKVPSSSSSITLTERVPDIQDVDGVCTRLLKVAYTSRHSPLFLLIIKKLVVQSLWHDFHPGAALLDTIETLSRCRSRYQRHVQQLLGVVYYRMLVDMQFMIAPDKSPVVIFPPDMDVERRMRFLSAHQSLIDMWDDLKHAPPEVSVSRTEDHTSCQANWDRTWSSAARKSEFAPCDCAGKRRCKTGHRRHVADVLALLKLTMISVSETIEQSHLICGECSLAGLEGIEVIRDDIINALGDLFVYC